MRFSDAKHRQVLDTSMAVELGRVEGFVVDAPNRRVSAVLVGKHKGGDLLPWDDVYGFGPDAVTVQRADAIVARTGDAGGPLVGGLVLSAAGHELGTVEDVEFDPGTGKIERLHLTGGAGLDGADLLAIGTYAVIVRAAAKGDQ